MRFNQAVTLLAAGKIEEAKAEYQTGMERSTKQVADAKAAKEEPPYVLWWSLDMAAQDLDASGQRRSEPTDGPPPPDKIANADQVRAAIPELVAQLKSLSVGLELNGQPPSAPLTAKVSPFQFGQAVLDADGIPTEDVTTAEEFEFGTQEVLVMFDYEGMTDGQEVVFKVFIDGEEDPSWRVITPWDLGASGIGAASRSACPTATRSC